MANDAHLGRLLLGRYRALKLLGSGAHGRVYAAEDLGRGGERVALKIVEGLVGAGHDEPGQEALRTLRHPCWADVLDAGRFAEYDWFQVTRLVDGPSLEHLVGAQPASAVARFLEDGARVLRALHARGLIHYDVTPGNWLVEGPPGAPRFVLTDGGLAHAGPVQGFARGTPLYMAPEVTEDRGHDQRVDLYSLGLVAYRLATGVEPLTGMAGDVLGRRRREPAPRARDVRPDLPPALDELITGLLAPDPSARIPDAQALLERLRALDPRLPLVRPDEAAAWTSGGPLVGRGPVRERLTRALEGLASTGGGGPRPAAGARTREPVLLLAGPEGSGGTRLVRELVCQARREELPVLLLAGRDGAPEREHPLARLTEGLRELARGAGSATPPGAPEASAPVAPAPHDDGRAIELVLSLLDEAAARAPVVLAVEDFGDLPPLAQEAVSVLSRHHLGRVERSTGALIPPVLLVVDVGRADVLRLVNPDAADPERAVLRLGPLSPDEVAELARERFPALSVAPEDAAVLARVSDGQPARVVELLAEAFQRGDLAAHAAGWTWNASLLATYPAAHRLPPALREALQAQPAHARAFLAHLALLEGELTREAAVSLWAELAPEGAALPSQPLLAVRQQGTTERLTLASQPLRRLLCDELTPEARRASGARLLRHLLSRPDPSTAADAAALLLEAGRASEALCWLHGQRLKLSAPQRLAVQPTVRALLAQARGLLVDPVERRRLAELLDRGADALAVARDLAVALPLDGRDLDVVLRVARVLEEGQDFPAARGLAQRHAAIATDDVPARAELHVTQARIAFSQRQPSDARTALLAAKRLIKSLGRAKREHPRLLAQYLKMAAGAHFDRQAHTPALRRLAIARRLAFAQRSAESYSEILNNIAIVSSEAGQRTRALNIFERAWRIRRTLGDVAGAIKIQFNLARLYLTAGNPRKAATRLQAAAAAASRHSLVPLLLECLRELAATLDMQHSTTPAQECLVRALRTAERAGDRTRQLRIAQDLLPIAVAAGEGAAAVAAIRALAHGARRRAGPAARLSYHVAMATSALLLGLPQAARLSLQRAARHIGKSSAVDRSLVLALSLAPGVRATGVRPGASTPRLQPLLRHGPRREILRLAIGLARRAAPRDSIGSLTVNPDAFEAFPGLERRVASSLLVAGLHAGSIHPAPHLLQALQEHLEGTSDNHLLARLLAVRSLRLPAAPPGVRADSFSRAASLLSDSLVHLPRRLAQCPQEHVEALAAHTNRVGGTQEGSRWVHELHASAHRLLLAAGRPAEHDPRRADALRQVLAVTAQIEAGVSLDSLLEGITRATADVTGAQRACVVLLDEGHAPNMRVATSVTAMGKSFQTHELSHTVVRRVLATRKPVLMHDAYGDEELLGRPSVTALSLRSILCVPMCRNAELFGVMYADSASSAGCFDQVDLEVLALFAEQAAAAIATNRLLNKVQAAYADLRAMQERLVRSERLRVIGEVSSGVAHEFNNLLTAILARVQLMGLASVDQEQQAHLALIEKATLDAASVVRRLQAFSRQQRTRDFSLVQVGELCRDAVEFLRPLWATRRRHGRPSIHVRTQAAPGLQVRGNATELREILTNLLKNALDALAECGGVIQVLARLDGETIEVRVQDNGAGIPSEVLAHVFDPFFTTKGEGGTGLGLCLSQRIAEQHAGELKLTSEVGVGSTAILRLPAARAECREPASAGGGPGKSPRVTRPVRVLIVDDDADVLKPLCAYLERSGYDVAAASGGEEALRMLPDRPYDVVLTDIGMPHIDGLELCRHAHVIDPNIPVVLMSGWASEVDLEKAHAAGAKALLAKPFAMQQVEDLLVQVTRGEGKA